MNKVKKAQSAIEFIILTGAFLFFMIVFIMVLHNKASLKLMEQNQDEIEFLGNQIKKEIDIASSTSDGYKREFIIPSQFFSKEYTARIDGTFLYIASNDSRYTLGIDITPVSGQLVKGVNTIRKENGIVYLN